MDPLLPVGLAHEFKADFEIASAPLVFGNGEVDLARELLVAFTANVINVTSDGTSSATLLNSGVVLSLLLVTKCFDGLELILAVDESHDYGHKYKSKFHYN